jgi:catechol 2,3-dioxygenase
MTAMVIRIERVGHVQLNVRDLERAVAFYSGVLGLREVGRYQGNTAFFSATGENHHDLALREVGPAAPAPKPDAIGLCHVALKIGTSRTVLRAAKAHVEKAGVRILRIENHRVSESIYLSDPDGNEVELYIDNDPRIWKDDPAACASAEPLEL